MVVVTRASQSSRQGSARSKPPLQSSSTSNHDLWVAKKLRGSYPPLTITSRTVIDPRREKVYIYGGFHDADKAQMPTPNFHVFDTKSMEFTDLTNSLTRVTAGDLILDTASKRRHHRLPSLSQPGLALLELRDSHIIFLFGGYDAGDIDGPSSSLIAINPVLKTWFRVEFETNDCSPPAPRINPVLVGVNESLYIFGGLKGFENPWLHHRSYSIAKFPSGLSSAKCRWIAVDVPYPDTIPTDKVFGRGLPVHDGNMILLLPGRPRYKAKMDYEKNSIFYFQINSKTFLQANVKGMLPRKVHWDFAYNYDPTLTASGGLLPSGSPPTIPSVFVCTWIPHGKRNLAPELWQYTVFPKDTFVRLGVSDRLYKFKKDLQLFSMIGDRAFLMGRGGQKRTTQGTKNRTSEAGETDGETDDDDDYQAEGAMCNTYIEIPLQAFLPKVEED